MGLQRAASSRKINVENTEKKSRNLPLFKVCECVLFAPSEQFTFVLLEQVT